MIRNISALASICAATALLVVPAAAQSGTAGTRDGAVVSGVGQSQTIDCQGLSAAVTGSDNDITFTGDCPGLTVTGTGNQVRVTLRPGAPIRVSGVDNSVSWRIAGNGKPRTSISGVNNRVSAAR